MAWTCCQTVGLDTSANSIPYLASWAEQASLDVLERAAALTGRLADRIERALINDDQNRTPGLAQLESRSMDETFLTVAEIAEQLRLNQQTVRNWI